MKRFIASVTLLCMLIGNASFVIASENDNQVLYEKNIELINASLEFNHVVVKNPELMPEDLVIECSNDDGETWINSYGCEAK